MPTQTSKFEVSPKQLFIQSGSVEKLDKKRLDVQSELLKLQSRTYKAMNKTSIQYYMARLDEYNFEVENKRKRTKEEIREKYGYDSIDGKINRIATDELSDYYSGMASQAVSYVTGNFKTANGDKKKSNLIINGEARLPCYGENTQCIFKGTQFNVAYDEAQREYYIDFSLFSQPKNKELGFKNGTRFRLLAVKPDKSTQAILNRCMSKDYKQGSLTLAMNKKGKWIVNLTYTFDKVKTIELDQNKSMGIDLGMVNVAVCSIFDKSDGSWDRNHIFINGDELNEHRKRLEKRVKNMQKSSAWASENKTGHGRKQRCNDSYKIADRYAKFKDTYNHKVSKYIVDTALKNNISLIQMEDLTGIKNIKDSKFLRSWAYYDLQQKIQYKAEREGIKVVKINPKNTSKRCSRCGCIDTQNRDGKKNQSLFKCITCGHEENADVNASKNIAIPNIDVIIKDYISKNK